jgi:hypothetical protein
MKVKFEVIMATSIWLSSGMLHRVVWEIMTDVSGVLIATTTLDDNAPKDSHLRLQKDSWYMVHIVTRS